MPQDIEIVRPVDKTQHFEISNYGETASTKKGKVMRVIALLVTISVILSAFVVYSGKAPSALPSVPEGTITPDAQMFDHLGRYVMHNFDQKKPMANFLSGLSGFWGVPMVSPQLPLLLLHFCFIESSQIFSYFHVQVLFYSTRHFLLCTLL